MVWGNTNSSIPVVVSPGSYLLLVSAAEALGSQAGRGPGALSAGSQPSAHAGRIRLLSSAAQGGFLM